MRNQRKRPHPLRFLAGALHGLLLLAFGLAVSHMLQLACATAPSDQCGLGLPGWMPIAWAVAVAACFLWSAYRAYRDYIGGEYYLDLLG